MKPVGWVVIALLAVGAFLAGRASVVPDDQELRDSLAVWRDHRKDDATFHDSTRAVILAERERWAAAEQEGTRWRTIANARDRTITDLRQRADAASRELADATTPADSLRACMTELVLRRSECAETARQNGDLRRAAEADSTAKEALRKENAAHLGQRGRDSLRLREADGLIAKLEKAAGGCRIPLVGVPCPIPLGGYNVTRKDFEAGAVVPFKLGRFRVGASVTWSP